MSMLGKRIRMLRRRNRTKRRVIRSNRGALPIVRIQKTAKHVHLECYVPEQKRIVLSASTSQKVFRDLNAKSYNCAGAFVIGEIMGLKLQQQGYNTIIFDRGGYEFHGRVRECLQGILKHVTLRDKKGDN